MNTPLESKIDAQAKALFSSTYNSLCVDNDRIFSLVLVLQWFACILIAIFVSPRTWLADMGTVHVHVWTAIVLGGLLSALPIYLNLRAPGKVINRYVNVIAQAFYSALFIHLTGGRIEAHFHVFASLAGFALYRDYRVLLAGTAIVAGDHAIRGIFFPQSAFGVFNTSEWRWMEHAAWVLFEDFFLGYACLRALSEMKVVARKTAEVMAQKDLIEYEVQKRTFELHESRNSVKLLLDNAGQGFFHFNREGKIGVECSKAVEKLFQVNPARMNISDLITSQSQADWKEQVDLLFNSPMPFSQLKEICPQSFVVNNRSVLLDYKPVLNDAGDRQDIMIIATDVTEIKKLEKRNKDEGELHRTLLKILKSKNELVELLDLLKEMPTIAQDPKTAMRNLHTLKGEFGYLECNKFSQLCHKLEDRLSSKYTPDEFLKGVQDLQAQVNQFLTDHDSILNMKGERHRIVPIEAKALADLVEEAKQLKAPDRIIRSLEAMTEVPIEECLGWMSDVFCQVGKEAGKEVKPISWKSSERICPDLYKGLFKSLIHISRNAAVHGIETPEEREAIGKPHEGSLRCEFKKQKNGDYYLRFQDDGKGIDVEAVKAKAKALGVPEPKGMKEVVNLLLSGKVSTSQKVTEISGRGIGLNAVQREVEKLGGTMEMSHEPGKGTNIEITFGNLEKKFENRSRLTA